MPERIKDVTLADRFTKTSHAKPTPALDPANNKFAKPLHVCIIGASRGIGASIAYAYAQAGVSTLILAARPSSELDLAAVVKHCIALNPTGKTLTYPVDITSSESVFWLAHAIQSEIPHLDILIFNSGYSGPVVLKISEGSPRDFQDVFDVNVQGTYLVAHHFIPLLKESDDSAKTFIVVGSFAACINSGHIANTAYCVSKFAQTRLVEFIAEQYKDEGILAIAVHPGAVLTEMANRTTPDSFRPCKLIYPYDANLVETCKEEIFRDSRSTDVPVTDLTDDVGLCGAFCLWLSREKRMWLNGRLVSATWDVDELLEKKDDVEGQDLLKWGFRVGDVQTA